MRGTQPDTVALASRSPMRVLESVRAQGGVELAFSADAATHASVHEHGGYRAIFPKVAGAPEAVIINTGGGMAGGDRITHKVTLEAGRCAVATTPSAERVYRSLGPDTRVAVGLRIAEAAKLLWLPQETILYSGARLTRTLEADVAPSGTLLVSEIAVFGREAMGETLRYGLFQDRWRVRRGGKLVFSEMLRLDGDIGASLSRKAVAGGDRVAATLLFMAPRCEDRLEAVRAVMARADVRAAASAWNGLLVMRALGRKAEAVRALVATVVQGLARQEMPRVWAT